MWRGLFSGCSTLPHIPTFQSRVEAKQWVKQLGPSNPTYPHCHQLVSLLVGWEQVENMLLLPRARMEPIATTGLVWPSVEYLYREMRCGVFVRIQGGVVAMFVPFVNPDYRNSWGWDVDIGEYQQRKEEATGIRENLLPVDQWWANSYILCNVAGENFWGDGTLAQYKHLLETVCRERSVGDTEFFLNKRDFPQLRRDGRHPHELFCGGPRDPVVDPAEIMPIFSGYTGEGFIDVAFPLPADWERANEGMYFPGGGGADPVVLTPWCERSATAVFRGGCTGGGTTPETNQRLNLVITTQDWEDVDAQLTSWNFRDKKLVGEPIAFTDPRLYNVQAGKQHFLTPTAQSHHKYVLYVDGHSAANRYSTLMASGFVILKVKSISTLSNQLWFFDKLVPHQDHLEVEADLSNLREVLDWCKAHDAECQAMANQAHHLWNLHLSREPLLDRVTELLWPDAHPNP